MNIRYVVSTMVFWWREHHLSFEQECEYLRNMGFGIEIWPTIRGNNDCRYVRLNWPRLKHATENMLVTLVSRKDNPNMDQWVEQIECAEMLGKAPIIASLGDMRISDNGQSDWGFAGDIAKLADEKGVKLCLETGKLGNLLEAGSRLETVKYCIDTGYINIDSEVSFCDYVKELAPRTRYIHLTDNYGKLDDHEPPGVRGGIVRDNWSCLKEYLDRYGTEYIGALEMFPAMPGTMIRQACKFLFDVLGWPNPQNFNPENDWTSYQPM